MPGEKLIICNICEDEGKRFSVPKDEFGTLFMRDHLREKHGVRPPNTIRKEL